MSEYAPLRPGVLTNSQQQHPCHWDLANLKLRHHPRHRIWRDTPSPPCKKQHFTQIPQTLIIHWGDASHEPFRSLPQAMQCASLNAHVLGFLMFELHLNNTTLCYTQILV